MIEESEVGVKLLDWEYRKELSHLWDFEVYEFWVLDSNGN